MWRNKNMNNLYYDSHLNPLKNKNDVKILYATYTHAVTLHIYIYTPTTPLLWIYKNCVIASIEVSGDLSEHKLHEKVL